MSNTIEITRESVRDELKSQTADEFLKANTKAQMAEKAALLGMTEDTIAEAKTKNDLLDLMVALAKLPNPSLRGMSEIDEPVAQVWAIADELLGAAIEAGTPPMRRKDVIAECQDRGITFYTARTQYQCWFTATDRGTRRLSDLDIASLPKSLLKEEEDEA